MRRSPEVISSHHRFPTSRVPSVGSRVATEAAHSLQRGAGLLRQPTAPAVLLTFFFKFFKIYLPIWLHQVLAAAYRIFVTSHGSFSLAVVRGLRCSVACGILVPQPGIEPESPALQGRFLTTRPLGKSPVDSLAPQLLELYPLIFHLLPTSCTSVCHSF